MRWSLEAAPAMMVRRSGSGPELVWIHGLGEQSRSLDPVAAHPALAGFSHVLVDLPGYGRSPWPEPDALLDDLEQLADRLAGWLGDRRPVLIGHSMGGLLATLIAERTAVRAVIDVDGNLSRGDCTHSAIAAAYSLDDFLAHGFATLRAEVYDGGRTDIALRGYHAAMTMASPRVFHHHAHQLVAMSEPETLVTRLAALRVPALFIAGVPDGICAHSRALLDRHAVRWIGIEPAGHWVHIDQPDRFVAAVADFLATL
ncbi:MAG TPA: alpha/beta hydrolase [Kofleriaceae bacterium]|jgi:pimeloyl-ACP methyl ester carboxylesterase|nr:alpha/beta hydrolase [Kofleriaceae bacterium]